MASRLAAALLLLALPSLGRADGPAVCPFVAGDLPAVTNPGGLHGTQIPINHILVLMQENRSYDHYFGRLHVNLHDAEAVPRGASNPDPTGGAPIAPFHKKLLCETADLDHGWDGSHLSWNGGAMDGFTAANVDPTDPTGARAMGFFTKHDLRYYYRLYSTFATSDRHFCSLLGPTWPNRHYLLAGTSFGKINNNLPTSPTEFSQRTIFEQLDEAGISWKVYQTQIAFAFVYAYVRTNGMANLRPIAEYYTDAAAGTLPDVAFIDPAFFGESENDEHPPQNAQIGQAFVAGVIDALLHSPLWSSSALFLTYDEHGGYWDHVPPPPACEPDDILPELGPSNVPGRYDRYGVRVPLIAVSPFARRRYVSHVTSDQTSVLRFIQTRFDLPALTRRDANASPLLELFDFANPPFVTPPKLPKAKINPRRAALCPPP